MTEIPIVQIDLPPGFIDLGMGNPDLSLLPLESMRRASEKFFSSNDPRPLQYGIEQGDGYFRNALASFLSDDYQFSVSPAALFVTNGASSALNLVCNLFTQPGDVVFAEEPSYFLALRIFKDLGLRVVPIKMDADGLSMASLEAKLAQQRPKFIYTIPTFQNPSGRTLSQGRRQRLVELAQEYDFLIVADEVYQFLNYSQTPPAPFAQFTEDEEQVISVNSFSKILAPGLRLGWIQAHEAVIRKLAGCGLLDSGGGMNPFASALLRHLIEAGDLNAHIAAERSEFSSRLAVMDQSLQQFLPDAVYKRPEGGFFFWVRFPGVDTIEMRPIVKQHNVDYRPGRLFSSQAGLDEYARMSFAVNGVDEINEGIKRLSKCMG
ncbi:MAG: PLP-dependent aminotransferase family protein [Anaerolineales bacterium]|nr:PLP-dependent aminotransferase family protein [Anaerolineales bacterium]